MAKPKKHKHKRNVVFESLKDSQEDNRPLSAPTAASGLEHGAETKMTMDRSQTSLNECREVFRDEMVFLWREMDHFRVTCRKQMEKQRGLLAELKTASRDDTTAKESGEKQTSKQRKSRDLEREVKKLERNMSFLEKHQTILDKEQSLVDKEEQLSHRQEKLREYEKEVQDIEQMLDKRQSWCDKRMQKIEDLNHEMVAMKQEMQQTVDDLETKQQGTPKLENSEEASSRARQNWTTARRHLIDKMTLLEATVQKYRTELASATTTVTARDLMVSRLKAETKSLKEDVHSRDRRIQQLESKLDRARQAQHKSEQNFEMLMEELQTMDLTSKYKTMFMQADTNEEVTNNKTSKIVRSVKKQASTFSIYTHESAENPKKSVECEIRINDECLQSTHSPTANSSQTTSNNELVSTKGLNGGKHNLHLQKHNSLKERSSPRTDNDVTRASNLSKSCVIM